MAATTCTVRTAVGGTCGKPAVYSFTGSRGEAFGECAEHFHGAISATSVGLVKVGDTVAVHRHGKRYDGRVVRVTKAGNVFAEVTYDNGVTRTVRV